MGRLKHEVYYAEYEEADIERFYKVLKLKKANQKYLQKFYNIGFTDEMLNNYYGTKKTVKESVGSCSYIFGSEKYKNFFLSYKINLQEFKEIKFLKKTKIKEIIIKARKLFGY